ncbi:hypothetical protein GCM10010531_08210 [Blastococcus jejuensis]|uniref:Uncharacterized protein n=1 Tax=Blastococcus jejuensis TaxID=351224 RepID=A0ABP6NVE0_9ACTN
MTVATDETAEPETASGSQEWENPFSLDDHYKGYAKDYIKELLTNIRETETALRRSLLIVVTLGFVFALSFSNVTAGLTFFSLRLDDVGPLLAVIPLVTAYQFGNIAGIVYVLYLTEGKFELALKAAYPRLAENDWANALYPANMVLHGPADRLDAVTGDDGVNAEVLLIVMRFVLLVLGPAAVTVAEVLFYGATVGWGTWSFIAVAVMALGLMLPGVIWLRLWATRSRL